MHKSSASREGGSPRAKRRSQHRKISLLDGTITPEAGCRVNPHAAVSSLSSFPLASWKNQGCQDLWERLKYDRPLGFSKVRIPPDSLQLKHPKTKKKCKKAFWHLLTTPSRSFRSFFALFLIVFFFGTCSGSYAMASAIGRVANVGSGDPGSSPVFYA